MTWLYIFFRLNLQYLMLTHSLFHPAPPHPQASVRPNHMILGHMTRLTRGSPIATCIPMPLPLSQAYPGYTLPSPYGPPPTIMGHPPSLMPTGDWNMGPPPQVIREILVK